MSKQIFLKGGFSERKGLKKFSNIIQRDSLNVRTRNKLYSVTKELLEIFFIRYNGEIKNDFKEQLYVDIFSCSIDDIPTYTNRIYMDIKEIFLESNYEEVFTFIEAIIYILRDIDSNFLLNYCDIYTEAIEQVFQEENVDYHIEKGLITDITSKEQIESIENTMNSKYDIVSKHYNNAVILLYKNKDYSNSIKESITSVEAMCQIINGSKQTLGEALKKLNLNIHPALQSAYRNLYGYTSDENGSRHANGIGEKDASFAEARYMLVSCSAFVDYLTNLYEEQSIKNS